MEELTIEVYEISLHDDVIAKVPFGNLESFLKCVLKANDSVNVSLGFITK